ncbi:MAG: hypothetical protein QOJ89_4477, partial [bacterium]
GSDKERAHGMLKAGDIEVDHVYGVEETATGTIEITFTHSGKARTAWAENNAIVHVMDGWDVLPPSDPGKTWRGGY